MCGRFTFQPTEVFYQRFQIVNRLDSLVARYNIAPGQMVPVIISQRRNQVVLMRWGLIPHWAKEEKIAYKMINARVETLAQRPAFRSLLAANRCLVPASGFYEWKREEHGKTPHYIHPKSGVFFAFAGLYDVWTQPDGEQLYTFTIITQAADDFMAHLHNRMPVILERDLEDAWLDREITNARAVLDILERSAGVALDAYPVSQMVNRPSVDSKLLIQPVK
jgi:putative SOS response-associated peptidase YedK